MFVAANGGRTMEVNMQAQHDPIEDGVIDLGRASERTLGLPDDILKENYVEPEARDE